MKNETLKKISGWLMGLGCLIPVLGVVFALLIHGCSSPNESVVPDDAINQKMQLYGGPGYDSQRQAFCDHIMQHPDVVQAEDSHTHSGDIDVVMRPGATDQDILAFARRLQSYMAQNYQGDDTYIVANITVYHNIADAPYANPSDPPVADPMGLMALEVTTGMDNTDSSQDTTWQIFKDGQIIK